MLQNQGKVSGICRESSLHSSIPTYIYKFFAELLLHHREAAWCTIDSAGLLIMPQQTLSLALCTQTGGYGDTRSYQRANVKV